MDSPVSPTRANSTADRKFQLTITRVELRVNEPPERSIVVEIEAVTTLPDYLKSRSTFTRTYAELDKLYTYLCKAFPDHIPAAPPGLPSTIAGRPRLEVPHFRKRLQAYLDRIASNLRFRLSEGMREFVQSEFEFLPPSVPTMRGRGGFMRVLTSSTPNVTEVDVFFDQAKTFATGAEANIALLSKAGESYAKVHKDMSVALAQASEQLASMSALTGRPLAESLRKTSKCLVASEKIHAAKAAYLASNFLEDCQSFAREAQAAQSALSYRLGVLQDYEGACKSTQKKLQVLDKLRAGKNINPEKVDNALEELKEVKHTESECRETLRTVGDTVKEEYTGYLENHLTDMDALLNSYIKRQLESSRKEQQLWESLEASQWTSGG
ncbi:Vacuolar protein sorting-associated protein 17 [Gaertneriomyces sp. JEL0708]|nr:Vacuolar protein sorting-associated protein 17 [Gaertneriomyces sp. JEL0708]